MKKMIIIFMSLIIGYTLYWCISNNDYKMDKKRSIIGEYKLDIYRTELGIYKDSIDKYKHLMLTFNQDMTFSLNFPVPFMAASHGIWEVGGMDEWGKLIYSNNIVDQFGIPYYDNGDSILYINSATPHCSQRNQSDVYKIFFVKIKMFDCSVRSSCPTRP